MNQTVMTTMPMRLPARCISFAVAPIAFRALVASWSLRALGFVFDLAATRGPRVFVFASTAGRAAAAGPSGLSPWTGQPATEEPDAQWKAAAFVRWHEPDNARGSSPECGPYAAHPKKDFP